MRNRSIHAAFLSLMAFTPLVAADNADKVERADWGAISRQPADGKVVLAVEELPADKRLPLPAPFDSIIGAYVDEPGRIGPGKMTRADVDFNADATKVAVLPPAEAGKSSIIILEIAEKSGQFGDGRIVFSALDAKVTGGSAKLETHPGNHRIGYWGNADDFVSWDFTASRPGMYSIELTYSLADGAGNDISVSLDDAAVKAKIAPTGTWYRYTTVPLGKVYVKNAGKHGVAVKCEKKTGSAVMNLKAVTFRPTGEGDPVKQSDDGSILLHSRDVTIHGAKVQYEPNPVKNTVGYWVNVADKAFWIFTVTTPGTFDVEILQGCGKGSGGAEVALKLLERTGFGKDQTLTFTVQDTGHFQNFVPRAIGRFTIAKAGEYTIEVKPLKKPGVAVMDLRQVKLTPVK